MVAVRSGHCAVTGLPFDYTTAHKQNPWAPSLDRRDPALGYTRENVRVVCWLYNSAKKGWPEEVFMVLLSSLRSAPFPEATP